MNKKAFTLVELIITITILAILGTLGFISFKGYLKQTRDSARINDLATIKKGIDIYSLDTSFYPQPTTGVDIYYSGSVLWTQGIFGTGTISEMKGIISDIPLDPNSKNPYTYSVNFNKKEYQVAGIIEGGEIASIGIQNGLQKTYAQGNQIARAIVKGDYNGKVLLTSTGGIDYILAIPSLILNNTNETNITNIAGENKFVYNNHYNLPASYNQSTFKVDGGFEYSPGNDIIVFSGSILHDIVSGNKIFDTANKLESAYSGTNVGLYSETPGQNKVANIQTTWSILQEIYPLNNIQEVKTCNDIKKSGQENGNGVYYLFNDDMTDIYQAYCDMNNGGWTFLFSVDPTGRKWAYDSIQWVNPVIDENIAEANILNTEFTSDAYKSYVGNSIKICRGDFSHCIEMHHNKNRTLQSFYNFGETYTHYSTCLSSNSNCVNGALPNNVNASQYSISGMAGDLGVTLSPSFSANYYKRAAGINITTNNKIGIQYDNNNTYPGFDNGGLGIGVFRSWNCGWNGDFVDSTRARSIALDSTCAYQTPDDKMWFVFAK